MQYAVVIEKTSTGFSAYAPDLPGCVATGPSVEAASRSMQKAIQLHLEGLAEDGEAPPLPLSRVEYLEPAPAA